MPVIKKSGFHAAVADRNAVGVPSENLIGCLAYLSRLKWLDSGEILKQLYGLDIHKCPCCGGRIQIHKSRHGQDLHKKSG